MDDPLALGKAESPDLAQRAGTVRQTMVSLFSALVGGMPRMREDSASLNALKALKPDWERAWQQASLALSQEQGSIGLERAVHILEDMRARLTDTLSTTSLDEASEHAALMIAGDRLLEQLDDYIEALKALNFCMPCQQLRKSPCRSTGIRRRRCRNGLRAMLTVLLGGAFWLATGWTNGSLMLAGLASGCALLSTAPNPAIGAFEFIKGTVAAVAMAFLCTFIVLPHVEGLPLLLLVLGLFLATGSLRNIHAPPYGGWGHLSRGFHHAGRTRQPHELRFYIISQQLCGLDTGSIFYTGGVQGSAAAQSVARRRALAPCYP